MGSSEPDRMREPYLLGSKGYKKREKTVCIYKRKKRRKRRPEIYNHLRSGKASGKYDKYKGGSKESQPNDLSKKGLSNHAPSRWNFFNSILVHSNPLSSSLTIHLRRIHGIPIGKGPTAIRRPLAPEADLLDSPRNRFIRHRSSLGDS